MVHVGCGLDTRFERVDDGSVEWFDLDMPDVMALRQKLIQSESNRYHTLATQVESLFLKLCEHFPGCELVCDAHTPFAIWADNLHLAYAKVKARMHWCIKDGKDVENWGEGIHLLDEWNYYEDKDSPLKAYRWIRLIPPLAKSAGIFHYRLGV